MGHLLLFLKMIGIAAQIDYVGGNGSDEIRMLGFPA